MPQMSPIQWTLFYNYFLTLFLSSAVIINFISIYMKKKSSTKKQLTNNKNLKW